MYFNKADMILKTIPATVFVILGVCSVLCSGRNLKRSTSEANCVDILSMERIPADNKNLFTVRFAKNAYVLWVKIHDGLGAPQVADVSAEGDVWYARVAVGKRSIDPWLVFADWDYNRQVNVQLNNVRGVPATQTNFVSLPVLESNRGELVYQPGHDCNVTYTVPFTNGVDVGSIGVTQHNLKGIILDTNEYVGNFTRDNFFHNGLPHLTSWKVSSNLTVKTSVYRVSGWVEMTMDVYNVNGDVVKAVTVQKNIGIRPSTQEEVLPDKYIGILRSPQKRSHFYGNEVEYCEVGSKCLYACHAIGHFITDLSVTVLDSNKTSNVDVEHEEQDLPYVRSVYWRFKARKNSGDEKGTTTFVCRAEDNIHGKVDIKLVEVVATIPPRFDDERSQLTIESNQATPDDLTVTLICVATGRPVPTITMGGGYWSGVGGGDPDTVEVTGRNEVTATKSIHHVSSSDVATMKSLTDMGLIVPSFCKLSIGDIGEKRAFKFP